MRQLTLARYRQIADELDAREDAQYQDALIAKAQESHFEHCSRRQLVKIWESGRNLKGRKLNEFEFRALCEVWVSTFGGLPPSDIGAADDASAPVMRPEPDSMLNIYDLVRITGLSQSTIKRMVAEGRFPAPVKLSPRRNGWIASSVIAWRDTRPS